MHIIVPIKQVPDTANVKMDPESGTMIREGHNSIINPLDLYSIELALQLKEQQGSRVTVISMGPPACEKALKEAIAMGGDDGILVSDNNFSGADTWATSYTLAQAVKEIRQKNNNGNDFDLIICGERATDGDTGQVGPGIAAWLNLPIASYVSKVNKITKQYIEVERMIEEGYQIIQLTLPAVLTVIKEIGTPRVPTLSRKLKARKAEVPVLNCENMDINRDCIGLKGSPTQVEKIENTKLKRGGNIVEASDENSLDQAIDGLIGYLKKNNLL